jgi:hypothetical protein
MLSQPHLTSFRVFTPTSLCAFMIQPLAGLALIFHS